VPVTLVKDLPRRPRLSMSLEITILGLKIADTYISKNLSQLILLGLGIRYKNKNLHVQTWW
jgi:hypothetical protein